MKIVIGDCKIKNFDKTILDLVSVLNCWVSLGKKIFELTVTVPQKMEIETKEVLERIANVQIKESVSNKIYDITSK